MKQNILTKILISMALIGTSANAYSNGFTSYVSMSALPISYIDKEHNEYEEEGNRMPSRRIQCTIDPTDGIQFVGMEKPEILTFEIYDFSGTCVAVFGDEDSFLDYLFAQSGEYQIRLLTANWAYIGYIGV